MAPNEQYNFAFPEGQRQEVPPVPPEAESKTGKKEYYGPARIEASEECPVCGNDFESVASCVACKNNEKKKEFLKGQQQ